MALSPFIGKQKVEAELHGSNRNNDSIMRKSGNQSLKEHVLLRMHVEMWIFD
jgi:hypothetical protein